jgi:hypothetical protein
MKRVFFATAADLASYYGAPEARRRFCPTLVGRPTHDHSDSPFATTAARRLTFAGTIDAILKLSVVASVLFSASSIGYYYLLHLPHRDAQLVERLQAAAQKRAEQEQLLFEQQEWERRAAEQQAAEERKALEKASRYQTCVSRATDGYNAARLAACNRPRDKIIKDQEDCVKLGFSRNVCAMAHVVPEASRNCKLPRTVALALDAEVEIARDRCVGQEN